MTSQSRTCSSCVKDSNNKKWDCPARMADGRLFTDYRPRCDIQLELRQAPNVGTHDYRQHLIHNGETIARAYRNDAFSRNYCGPCMQPYDIGTMLPEADLFVCDKVACVRNGNSPNGLGTGRDYGTLPENRHARDQFLERQAVWQRALEKDANCCVPAPMVRNFTPRPESSARWAVPGGGRPSSTGDASVA